MKWIKASERLPEKYGNYYIRKGEARLTTTYDNYIGFGISGDIEWLEESEVAPPPVQSDSGVEEVYKIIESNGEPQSDIFHNVIEDVLNDSTFRNEGLEYKLADKYLIIRKH